jgi:hypothetical protein
VIAFMRSRAAPQREGCRSGDEQSK